MQPAIRADGLAKRYHLGAHQSAAYQTLRESITSALAKPWGRLASAVRPRPASPPPAETPDVLWALKEVSFEIAPGEVIGIIGGNGAGKSTLLKILSRITEPSSGRVEIRGRVGSLLEVGTGFHPELSGRENVYLSGAILGMSRHEITRRFDDIVAFAEVERFLDTPVKRYSSGMYVRLAFAVAAHLEPDVLLVDEVLAVGDASFQRKCLGLMGDASRSGRTVLLVSHQMAAVESLCKTCALFDHGRLDFIGDARTALARYQARQATPAGGERDLSSHPGRQKGSAPTMTAVTISAREPSVRMGDPLEIRVRFESRSGPFRPVLGVVLKTGHGLSLFGINNRIVPGFRFEKPVRSGTVTCRFASLPVMPGTYTLDLYLGNDYRDVDTVQDAISFEVVPQDVFGSGKLPPPTAGPFCWPAEWSLESCV